MRLYFTQENYTFKDLFRSRERGSSTVALLLIDLFHLSNQSMLCFSLAITVHKGTVDGRIRLKRCFICRQ